MPRAFAIVVVIEFIRVGGTIQVEVKEKKNRVESAFNAPRATVKGRPSRRWHCPPARHPIAGQSEADDQKTGIDIVRRRVLVQRPSRLSTMPAVTARS